MPIHDWTRVGAGTFHDFHCTWVPEIKNRLNTGLLPGEYYAQVEQSTGGTIADVLTLHSGDDRGEARGGGQGGSPVTLAPPKVRHTAAILETSAYAAQARRIVVRHGSDDRIVALIEILSPGNKAGQYPFRTFVEKAASAVAHGYHLLLIDLLPPGPRDPQGIHGATWSELGGDPYEAPAGLPPDTCLLLRRPSRDRLCRADRRRGRTRPDAAVPERVAIRQHPAGGDLRGRIPGGPTPLEGGARAHQLRLRARPAASGIRALLVR